MTYALGQAKWVPGQISFATTRTGRLPSVQPLIEAGLPYAPYIEHGSFVTGQPDIARYGRDPYRGLYGLGEDPFDIACRASGGEPTTRGSTRVCEGGAVENVTEAAREGVRSTARAVVLVSFGAGVGLAAGVVGGFTKKATWGGLIGGVGGGILGYLASRQLENV